MIGFISKILGNKSKKDVELIQPLVVKTNEEFAKLTGLSNDELRDKTNEFKKRIKEHVKITEDKIEELKTKAETDSSVDIHEKEQIYNEVDKLIKSRDTELEVILAELLPEAFAVVKETAGRFKDNDSITVTATQLDKDLAAEKGHIEINGDQATWSSTWLAAGLEVSWDMMHYDVQLVGGIVLHQGKIAEMATGEGKTLVATLPAYLNALSEKGVHIVTVNDYLARRDSEWMGPIMEFLGITVDCIDKYEPHSEERKKAYASGITYGTNNEFGFDYLRDNMSRDPEDLVMAKLHYAMVDEVDSVLIDDARTPLIISGPVPKGEEHQFHDLKPRIQKLVEAQRKEINGYLTNAKKHIEEGKDGVQEGGLDLLRAHRGLPKNKATIKYLSEPGMRAILQKTENHFMQDQSKEMPTADAPLYFTIDEKNNNIDLTEKGLELITGAGEDVDFFVLPDIGSDLVEIEKKAESDEDKLKLKDALMEEYGEKTERIHSVQQLLKAYTLFEKDVEYVVMEDKVKIVDENTGRIMEGRRYSDGLHQAIEAKENVKVEAATQTHATVTLQNFFRMYHKLSGMTGTAETEASELWEIYKLDVVNIPTNVPIVRDDRQDLVYKTTREKYNAIGEEVNDLVAKGRPVLVGTTSVEVSELLSRMLKMKGVKHKVLNAKQHQSEAEIVAGAGQPGAVTIATNMAGRGTDIKLTPEVVKAGGLAIVGSERHESRRIDRQLRGRAGRQGDPGSTQFFVSLEDNLMRLFGSARIAKLMDRMGYEEGEVIQHSMITKSIERAQKKVEENNFGTRKHLIEYDDVMNSQREVIYRRRKHALFGERLSLDIDNMFYDLAEEIITLNQDIQDYESFKIDMLRFFSSDPEITEEEFLKENPVQLTERLYAQVRKQYDRKMQSMLDIAMPIIKDVHKDRGATLENIVVPFTDAKKVIQVVTPLQETVDTEGGALLKSFEKGISLAIIDESWKEHLREMDDLKQSVQAARFEQKDPLLIYKFEAFELFKKAMGEISRDMCSFMFRSRIPSQDQNQVKEARQTKTDAEQKRMKAGRDENAIPKPQLGAANNAEGGVPAPAQQRVEPVRVGKKVGRNEPCPCGSGKKYKHCHGLDS